MKKIVLSILLVSVICLFQGNAFAQHYYTYDGDTFNVLLTANNADTQIISVKFSYNGQWVDFKIIDFESLEGTDEGGFLYTVQDGKGKQFTIDYYRDYDYIKVNNLETGDEWTLNRRQ
jgi:hypothetical protein